MGETNVSLGIYPREMKTCLHKAQYMMFIAAWL